MPAYLFLGYFRFVLTCLYLLGASVEVGLGCPPRGVYSGSFSLSCAFLFACVRSYLRVRIRSRREWVQKTTDPLYPVHSMPPFS